LCENPCSAIQAHKSLETNFLSNCRKKTLPSCALPEYSYLAICCKCSGHKKVLKRERWELKIYPPGHGELILLLRLGGEESHFGTRHTFATKERKSRRESTLLDLWESKKKSQKGITYYAERNGEKKRGEPNRTTPVPRRGHGKGNISSTRRKARVGPQNHAPPQPKANGDITAADRKHRDVKSRRFREGEKRNVGKEKLLSGVTGSRGSAESRQS